MKCPFICFCLEEAGCLEGDEEFHSLKNNVLSTMFKCSRKV